MGIQPRKRFGQHWLRSDLALAQIVAAAQLTAGDRVLEIGPGLGVLTQQLLDQAQTVVSVEIDRDLCEKLAKRFGDRPNFLLLSGDFLALNLQEYFATFPQFFPINKIVANIPYNITGPILEKLLGTIAQPFQPAYASLVLLMQKEVADRLVALPGTKAYNGLSVRMQYLAQVDWIAEVPRTAFKPPPQVNSAIIRLRPYQRENPAQNPAFLEKLVKLGFANRRKMLRNNLKGLIDSDRLLTALETLTISAEARAEEVSLEQWIELSNLLSATDF